MEYTWLSILTNLYHLFIFRWSSSKSYSSLIREFDRIRMGTLGKKCLYNVVGLFRWIDIGFDVDSRHLRASGSSQLCCMINYLSPLSCIGVICVPSFYRLRMISDKNKTCIIAQQWNIQILIGGARQPFQMIACSEMVALFRSIQMIIGAQTVAISVDLDHIFDDDLW